MTPHSTVIIIDYYIWFDSLHILRVLSFLAALLLLHGNMIYSSFWTDKLFWFFQLLFISFALPVFTYSPDHILCMIVRTCLFTPCIFYMPYKIWVTLLISKSVYCRIPVLYPSAASLISFLSFSLIISEMSVS